MPVPLSIAVAQPPCVTGDLTANAEAHALTVLAARSRLVVFPELSLTGYDLEAPAVAVDDPALAAIVDACGTLNTIALVGTPVDAPPDDGAVGGRSIAILLIDAHGARVVYRKQHLGSAEAEHFTPGPRPVVLELDGWRVGLGVCRDTGIGDHVKELANAGIDLYVAGFVDDRDDVPGVRGLRQLRRTDGRRVRRDGRSVRDLRSQRSPARRDLRSAGRDRPGPAGLTRPGRCLHRKR